MTLTWHESENAEPLIFMPSEIASHWGGGDKRTDYAPNCKADNDFTALCEIIDDQAPRPLLTQIIFKENPAIVLVGEDSCFTTWVAEERGGFFAQIMYEDKEGCFPAFLETVNLFETLDNPDKTFTIHNWAPSHVTIVSAQEYILMSSLNQGPDDRFSYGAPMRISLSPGEYLVTVARWNPDDHSEYLIYRLSGMD